MTGDAVTEPNDLSPLQEIELLVQSRARSLELDALATPQEMEALVQQAVAEWSLDHKRGARRFDLPDPERITRRAVWNLTGYGPLAPLLADDDVWEIMVNAPSEIFVKRHTGPNGYHDEVFHDDDHVSRTLTKILSDSTGAHRKLDPSEGLQDAQLDDGSRMHIVHGDIGRGGHVMVNIRKFSNVAFHDLNQLVARDMLDQHTARFLRTCVRSRASIVFAGAPGSGKTTLLSCCCADLDPTLRVVVAEEVFEADVPVANVHTTLCMPRAVHSVHHGQRHHVGQLGRSGVAELGGDDLVDAAGAAVGAVGQGQHEGALVVVELGQGDDGGRRRADVAGVQSAAPSVELGGLPRCPDDGGPALRRCPPTRHRPTSTGPPLPVVHAGRRPCVPRHLHPETRSRPGIG